MSFHAQRNCMTSVLDCFKSKMVSKQKKTFCKVRFKEAAEYKLFKCGQKTYICLLNDSVCLKKIYVIPKSH